MSELEQWCAIDGHEWVEQYYMHGQLIGPQTMDIFKRCVKCCETEHKRFIPTPYPRPSLWETFGLLV